MFRHAQNSSPPVVTDSKKNVEAATDIDADEEKKTAPVSISAISDDDIKDLLEKNLKWSQIIYEQNRKINGKLLWSAVANWLRFLLLLGSIIAALIYLPPLLGNVLSQYQNLLGISSAGQKAPSSIGDILQLLNVDKSKEDQIKALIK